MGKLDGQGRGRDRRRSGIGRAIATLVREEGAAIAIIDLDAARPKASRGKRAIWAGAPWRWPRTSPTRRRSASALERIFGELGELDILVNNAGIDTTSIVEQCRPRCGTT